MKPYHKIQTVYLRDPENKFKTLLMGKWALPEFEYLRNCQWEFTEKVDGTNIRIIYDGKTVAFMGKSDNAQIPGFLLNQLRALFDQDMSKVFEGPACIYGEGYGAKIQKGGGNYSPKQNLAIFDINIDGWWLKREDVLDIAIKLGIGVAPIIGCGTLYDMVDCARVGFNSAWGNFTAEGIVARPVVELKARNGHRIITKIKYKDFERE